MLPIHLRESQEIDKHRRGMAAFVKGPLDAEDMARVLTTFRGQPTRHTPPMRFERSPADGDASVYVFDEESAIVYVLD